MTKQIETIMALAFAYRMADTVDLWPTERDLRTALEAALKPGVEPIGWSITWNKQHTGNFYASKEAATVRMIEMNTMFPNEPRTIEPLFAQPPAQTPDALKPGGEPIGYLAFRRGKPSWDEDCVCEDPVYPVDSDDDRVSIPIYTAAPPAQTPARLRLHDLMNVPGFDYDAPQLIAEANFARAIETAVRRSFGVNDE